MTREERAKQVFKETRSQEFMHYVRCEWQYFNEVCGLDADTYIAELEKVAKKENSELLDKYMPEGFRNIDLNISNEILEEAIRRKVDIRETIAYQEYCEEMKNKQQDDGSKMSI